MHTMTILTNKIYIIKKIIFDNSENDSSWATSEKILGFVYSEKDADSKLLELNNCKKYEGWDGEMYPCFVIEIVNKL